jgi:hypothetical protein
MPIDLKISQLTDGTIIQPTDEIPVSRGGANRRVKVGALAALDSLSKADVGLGNVDNTSDSNKPVSTAQQTALDLKANLASPTFTGTVSGITKAMVGLGSVVNADTTTTSNITDSINKRFVTDAQLTDINNALVTSDIGSTVQAYDANTTKNNVAQQFTKQHSFLQTTLASGVPINWNLDDNQNASIILTSTAYLLPVNIKNGADYTLTVKQDAVGSRVILFSNLSFKFPSGGIPVLSTTPNATDVLKFTASNGVLLLTNFDINFISESFIKKKIDLFIEDNDIVLNIIVKDDNNKNRNIMMVGGRESFVLYIAFKIVLAKIAHLPKSNFIFIDEGISVFDKEHLNNITDLFSYLNIVQLVPSNFSVI